MGIERKTVQMKLPEPSYTPKKGQAVNRKKKPAGKEDNTISSHPVEIKNSI
jgi:hypothetical protein